jgi:hypothetical protein
LSSSSSQIHSKSKLFYHFGEKGVKVNFGTCSGDEGNFTGRAKTEEGVPAKDFTEAVGSIF